MKDKILELKLALIYEKLLNLDNLIYLEHGEAVDFTLENIKSDVFELWDSYRLKKHKPRKYKQISIPQIKH
jgi:hypothetical protein